ncbi:iron transporter [Planotetraspora thailandica]|uniref:Iron transporter n=1 Tax=Planotetraspora thailandica TaxID=487172 RepID=A0A8J3V540_9ACTN|nr:IucA/IucC family protein [Planotetraspora thailandica]GII57026.1 iron transporter [Planotetraspora thailandica]
MDGLLLDPHLAMAEEATLGALLRCCARELCGPRGRLTTAGPYTLLRVAGTTIRVRAAGGIALRFEGPAEWLDDDTWRPLTSELLVELAAAELKDVEQDEDTAPHPREPYDGNDEFAAQVAASRDAVAALLTARARATPPRDPWLASEHALVSGHPFHPSPKAHTGPALTLHAPEAHARFPLRLLAVRADLVSTHGDATALDALGAAPPGYTLLPAHPWQADLLAAELREPLADGRLIDLGYTHPVTPTSSVRTVYEPVTGNCLKLSLDVRITNCVRKNAWYELAGAVELTRRLRPVFDRLAMRFPGTGWLPEPGSRSAALGTRLLEALGVIVREGPWQVCGPGVTPLLAGALAVPGSDGVPQAVRTHRQEDPLGWWKAYVERVAPPVLEAYFAHGVVLEPHVQNVLVGVDSTGLPVEVMFRDLEGTKLVAGRHDLSGLPARVGEAMTYEAGRGWNRVVYCLMVNHLAEVAATLAETGAPLPDLWAAARKALEEHAERYGRPEPLGRLLDGAPLPAKANLAVRWARAADRAAGYVSVASPFTRP